MAMGIAATAATVLNHSFSSLRCWKAHFLCLIFLYHLRLVRCCNTPSSSSPLLGNASSPCPDAFLHNPPQVTCGSLLLLLLLPLFLLFSSLFLSFLHFIMYLHRFRARPPARVTRPSTTLTHPRAHPPTHILEKTWPVLGGGCVSVCVYMCVT